MNVHLSYKASKTPDVEREFQIQIEKLQKRLHIFNPDLIHLHGIVEQESGRNTVNTVVSLNLRLPSGQMTAQKPGEKPVAAVKAAFADVVAQLTRHKELLRGQWTGKSSRTARGKAVGGVAFPAELSVPPQAMPQTLADVSVRDNQVNQLGADWVSANLVLLRRFVDHELRTRVLAGQIREGQITPEEVIDEVMVSALTQEGDVRAELLSRESWFHRLAMQAIRQLVRANADTATVSLDASAGTPNVTGSDENTLQYHQPDDSLQEENVIRDQSVRTPEEIFASEEMVAQLNLALLGLGPQDREAFVLYTLEGFTVEEIARLSGRSPDLVRKSIHHARERVQQKLPEHNEVRLSLLRRLHVA